MKELKTYISEGFFSNVGANNPIKRVIDIIKDVSINDKINSDSKRQKFRDLLTSILKDIETDIKKGKFVFEYIRNIGFESSKITITLEITEPNNARWTYSDNIGKLYDVHADYVALNIAGDLYYGTKYLPHDPKLRHSIANTIKVTEFKLS